MKTGFSPGRRSTVSLRRLCRGLPDSLKGCVGGNLLSFGIHVMEVEGSVRIDQQDTVLDTAELVDMAGRHPAEAARRSLEVGDTEAARWHVAQVALFTETLVQTHLLDLADGRAVLETARHLLTQNTD